MGGKTITKILDDFLLVNIKVLGIWGFSEDNWKRSDEEIIKIMEVIENVISSSLQKLIDNNIKFMVLGKRDKIKQNFPSLLSVIEKSESITENNTGKILALFVDYGERYQMEEFARARNSNQTSSTYELISGINKGLPLFDMVLRTSGEMRLSGFGPLVSLAEFVSVKKNLPDLNDSDMLKALNEYSGRQRRFGGR
jgi:undecaprenyl diphosphate synthase